MRFHLTAFLCQKREEKDAPNVVFWKSLNGANGMVIRDTSARTAAAYLTRVRYKKSKENQLIIVEVFKRDGWFLCEKAVGG